MRHLPFAIKTLPWSQYDALQLNGVNPLPINVASDSSLHQSRNSLPELIGVSSRCAIADDAIRTNSSDTEPFIVIPPSNRRHSGRIAGLACTSGPGPGGAGREGHLLRRFDCALSTSA